MAHDRLEVMPSRKARLTQKQFGLLAWVYLDGYRSLGHSQITWSPRAYMGRSLNRSEAATLSKRVSTLIDQGLLERWEKELKLTDLGRHRLHNYVLQNPDELKNDILLIRLALDDDLIALRAYSQMAQALRRYRDGAELNQEALDRAMEGILPVHAIVLRRISEGATRLQEALEASEKRAKQLRS